MNREREEFYANEGMADYYGGKDKGSDDDYYYDDYIDQKDSTGKRAKT